MALTEQQRERLAALREKDAERDTASQDAADARELEGRELVLACEAKGWKEGHDFKIVSNPIAGVFAVRKPDARGIRTWENATEKQRLTLEWVISFLRHYIVGLDEQPMPQAGQKPEDGRPLEGAKGLVWAQASAQRPGLCWQTSRTFLELMGVDFEALEKKA